MSNVDPAVSPLRDAEPTDFLTRWEPTPEWTLTELCKIAWVAKKIKLSYRFLASDQTSGSDTSGAGIFWWWHIYENQRSEQELVCNSYFYEIDDGRDPDDTDEIGTRFLGYSYENTLGDDGSVNGSWLGEHGTIPFVFFGGACTTFQFEDLDPAPLEEFTCYMGIGPAPTGLDIYNVRTREGMYEVVTRDNTGAAKSVFYDVHAYQPPPEYPFDPWPGDPLVNPWAGVPTDWGFRINDDAPTWYEGSMDLTPYIKIEVLEWYSYDGTWDTETGELLVADPWNP